MEQKLYVVSRYYNEEHVTAEIWTQRQVEAEGWPLNFDAPLHSDGAYRTVYYELGDAYDLYVEQADTYQTAQAVCRAVLDRSSLLSAEDDLPPWESVEIEPPQPPKRKVIVQAQKGGKPCNASGPCACAADAANARG